MSADPDSSPELPALADIIAHEVASGLWSVISHYAPKPAFEHLVRLRVREGVVEACALPDEEWEPLADFCNVVAARPVNEYGEPIERHGL